MRAVIGSVCYVVNNDQILLLQRNHRPFEGRWDGLGGLVDFGESPEEAARREVFEESGLRVESISHRAHLLLYNTESEAAISVDLFVAAGAQGELKESQEGLPVWVPRSQVMGLDLVGFMQITFPLVLTPESFLTGTIWHDAGGEPNRYSLRHLTAAGARVLEG